MSRPIRWGILGTGQVAHGFAQGLRALPDAELLAVNSRTPANAQAFAHHYGVPHVYATAAELARDQRIDVVYVATPNQRHMDDSLLCLEHGRAVLCEKPFALNADQARRIVAAARRAERFCMEAMWMRCIPAIRKAHELLKRGAIGELRMIQADFGVANQFDPASRLFDPEQGGGALLDLGVYPLSLAVLLGGMPEAYSSQATIGSSGVDEQVALLLRQPGGVLANLSASLRSFSPTEALIMGSKGQLRIHAPLYAPTRLTLTTFSEIPSSHRTPRQARRIRALIQHNRFIRAGAIRLQQLALRALGRGSRRLHLPLIGNGYTYEAAEVMRCLRVGALESPLMPLDESVQIMELVDRLHRAARQPAHVAPL